MSNIRKVNEYIDYIGVNDRKIQRFENQFPLSRGISYNSYLIKDEKTCLIDTSDQSQITEFMDNLGCSLEGRSLDYLVLQHLEPDHCGSILTVMRKYSEAQIYTSEKGKTFFRQFYGNEVPDSRINVIKDGDTLNLGSNNLKFIAAPMVHWPEVMMTYEENSGALFSADAFGAFGAINGHLFADRYDFEKECIDEMRRYYVNVVGKHGAAVQRLFKKIKGLKINYILPLHSICFRTENEISKVISYYDKWSSYEPENKGVLTVFSSMYGNTAAVCEKLMNIISEKTEKTHGLEKIKLNTIDVSQHHPSEIAAEAWKYSVMIFAGMNYNTELYPPMDVFLRELMTCGFQNRKVFLIGNMSWGGRSLKIMEEILSSGKNVDIDPDPFVILSSFKDEQNEELQKFASKVIEKLV